MLIKKIRGIEIFIRRGKAFDKKFNYYLELSIISHNFKSDIYSTKYECFINLNRVITRINLSKTIPVSEIIKNRFSSSYFTPIFIYEFKNRIRIMFSLFDKGKNIGAEFISDTEKFMEPAFIKTYILRIEQELYGEDEINENVYK